MIELSNFRYAFASLFLVLMFNGSAQAQVEDVVPAQPLPVWNLELLSQPPATHPAPDLQKEGVRGLFYDGLPYHGKPTRVFAWVGFPDVPPGTKVPGIVLVHGGGGTAFDTWVRRWTARGYAAIAMDNCGGIPIQNESKKWKRHDHSGPDGWGGWNQIDEPWQDHWTYHAVADILLAHSLLRSFPEVDSERTGITGISWGGYLTCIAAGVDPRFRFAVPVYGCGFTDENGFAGQLAKVGPAGEKRWMKWWDPSVYLPAASMPILWVNGSNDAWYTLNAMQKSYRLPTEDRTLSVRLRMPHGHGEAGEGPKEIHVFADSLLTGGSPLAKITSQGRDGRTAWATFECPVPVKQAELNVTSQSGRWQDRHWERLPATIEGNRISAIIPEGTTVYYFNLTDSRDCAVSTEHEELTSAP
ncbi:MAG TPA: acetylxylan esterase [Planctomicrobium sp.]|nr:acetylxylan esterase [Planctomicrobium sp.]